MRLTYDPRANAVSIRFVDGRPWSHSTVDEFGLILDFDADQRLIGIEMLIARQKLPPALLEEAKQGDPPA